MVVSKIKVSLIACICLANAPCAFAETRQELLESAVASYNAGVAEAETAVSKAAACIAESGDEAQQDQHNLGNAKVRLPMVGHADPTSKESRAIFDRGVLNDTAFCLWIEAKSYERLKRCEDAAKAFHILASLNYARVWDSQQSVFWEPAKTGASWMAAHPGGRC